MGHHLDIGSFGSAGKALTGKPFDSSQREVQELNQDFVNPRVGKAT